MNAGRRSASGAVLAGVLAVTALVAAAPPAGAQTPGAVLVVVIEEKGGSMLGIIDPVAAKLIARVPTGPDPHIVAVSDDGKLAFVANTNGHGTIVPDADSISIVDIAARKEIRRVPAGNSTRPSDIEYANGKVYFTASGFRALGVYDMKRDKVDYFGLGQGGPDAIAFSKDLNTIYAVNADTDNISIIENVRGGPVISYPPKPTDWTVTVVPVTKGQRPEDIQISPDGKELWTINELGGGVSIINIATKTSQDVNLQTKHANRLRFTPDGKYVLILDRDTGEMVVVDAAARKVAKRIKFTGDKPGESISVGNLVVVPDGSRAYASVRPPLAAGRDYVAEIDLKTLAVTNRISLTGEGNGLAWAAAPK